MSFQRKQESSQSMVIRIQTIQQIKKPLSILNKIGRGFSVSLSYLFPNNETGISTSILPKQSAGQDRLLWLHRASPSATLDKTNYGEILTKSICYVNY
jgi:hypothetical protein